MARNVFGSRKITREDRYTKGKISFTKSDEYWEYFKMFMICVGGYLFFHFIIMGWHF